jgi:hypothetical protein
MYVQPKLYLDHFCDLRTHGNGTREERLFREDTNILTAAKGWIAGIPQEHGADTRQQAEREAQKIVQKGMSLNNNTHDG